MVKRTGTFILFLFLFKLLTYAHLPHKNDVRKAVHGIIDIRGIDIGKIESIPLNGEWAFYWKKIIQPGRFSTYQPDTFIKVPNSWNDIKKDNKSIGPFGYGTYRLLIIKTKSFHRLKLHITENIVPASRYYINGKLAAYGGRIDTFRNINNAESRLHFIEIECTSDTIELVAQIANYQVEKGGLFFDISLGEEKNINEMNLKDFYVFVFIAGILFIMSLYHFSLYFFRPKDIAPLAFALFCLTVVVYFFHITGLINYLFPNLSYETSIKILRISLFGSQPALCLLMYALFPSEFNKKIIRILIALGLLAMLIVALFPSYIHCQIAQPQRIFMLLIIFYTMYGVSLAVLNDREYSKIFIFGFLVFTFAAINDLLLYTGVIASTDLTQYGLFVFIFTQIYILSSRFSNAFIKSEQLSDELIYMNENLEKLIQIRTHELEKRNEEIQKQSNKIQQQNNDLEISNRQINESITYASRIQKAMFQSPKMLSQYLPPYFILLKPKQIVSGDFYWVKLIDEYIVFVAADCTGHGVPGAFMSILGISFLNDISFGVDSLTAPNLILDKLRHKVAHALNQNEEKDDMHDGMDISLLCIDTNEGLLYFSGAKMPLYIVRKKDDQYEIIRHNPNTMSLGVYSNRKHFDSIKIELQEGDCLYTFTDGLIDQFGGEMGKKFNTKNLEALLLEIQPFSMDIQKRKINQAFEKWKGKDWYQIDDILITGLKYSKIGNLN